MLYQAQDTMLADYYPTAHIVAALILMSAVVFNPHRSQEPPTWFTLIHPTLAGFYVLIVSFFAPREIAVYAISTLFLVAAILCTRWLAVPLGKKDAPTQTSLSSSDSDEESSIEQDETPIVDEEFLRKRLLESYGDDPTLS